MTTETLAESIGAVLTADHARLHDLLDRALRTEPLDAAAYAAFRAGLLRHIAIEEKLLIPEAVGASAGEPIAEAHALRVDHAALTSLLVPTPDSALCREIASLLEAHDAKEEGALGVYAECERRLGAERSRALGARALAYPAIRLAKHFDGHGTVRTAALALAAARRISRARRAGPG